MKKKHSKKRVTAGMHYATMAALIVSNITVFILCILFSGLLGTGLANIAIIGSQGKASAQIMPAGRLHLPSAPRQDSPWVWQSRIEVQWWDSTGEDYYIVERLLSSGPELNASYSQNSWTEVAQVDGHNCDSNQPFPCSDYIEYVDWDVDISSTAYPKSTYSYRIVAVNADGRTRSNTVKVVPFYDAAAPDAPTNFHLVSLWCQSTGLKGPWATFEWNEVLDDNPEQGAIGMNSYIFHKNSQTYTFADGVSTFDFYYGTPQVGKTFDHWLTAQDWNGNQSAGGEHVSVTVPPCSEL